VGAYEYLVETAEETIAVQQAFLQEQGGKVVEGAEKIGHCIKTGGKILILGNGGSAADAQHMAAEMVGRMLLDRRPLPALALSTDTSNLTAIGNDFGFDQVFVKQIQALAQKGDVVIAISTSGNSRNVLLAVEVARSKGCIVIGLTGGTGGKLKGMVDLCLNVSHGRNSSRIQETHAFIVHSLVDLVDRFYLEDKPEGKA